MPTGWRFLRGLRRREVSAASSMFGFNVFISDWCRLGLLHCSTRVYILSHSMGIGTAFVWSPLPGHWFTHDFRCYFSKW